MKFKIGLCMIVKNEEAVIGRCLDSTLGLIDSYCILDTGSTDKTKTIVSKKLKGKQGKLHSAKWTNFGEARTKVLALVNEQTDVDWWLMLDADMTIEYHRDFKTWLEKDAPKEVDAWMVEIAENAARQRLPLLTRAGIDWKYIGATHEYLDYMQHVSRSLLGLTIYHHADGTSRPEKFERDLKLLQSEFDAGDPRATFYAAESLRFLHQDREAIAAYDKRAGMGGFEEEAWYAQYMAGKLALEINPADGAKRLIAAYQRRPSRAEPLYHLINWCGQHYPDRMPDDLLFIESWVYNKRPPQ